MTTEIINTCRELLKDSKNIDQLYEIIDDNYETGDELAIAQLYDDASYYDDAIVWLMEADSEESASVILQWAEEAETNKKKLIAVASSDDFLDALAEIDASRFGILAKELVNADMDDLAKDFYTKWPDASENIEERIEFLKILIDRQKAQLAASVCDYIDDDELWEYLDIDEIECIVKMLEKAGCYEGALDLIVHDGPYISRDQEELLDWWLEDLYINDKKRQVTSANNNVKCIIGELLSTVDPKCQSSITETPHFESWTEACYYCKFYDTALDLMLAADCLGDSFLVENLIIDAIDDENEEFVKRVIETVLCNNGSMSFDEYLAHPTINNYVLARLLFYQGKRQEALALFGRAANSKNKYKEEAVKFIEENYSEADAALVLKRKKSKSSTDKTSTVTSGTKSVVGRGGRKKKTFFQKAMNTIKKMF